MKIQNIPLKIAIFFASVFATLAAVLGFRVHYEQQKNLKTYSDIKDYMDQLMQSDIVIAQRDFAKDRDMLLQKSAHTSTAQVTQQATTTTVTPQKIVTPTVTTKPKATKKTKTS
jgi:vacuolar-type H+-ATPase catalytic subunit A/Vma1